jgi:hypothetical protein
MKNIGTLLSLLFFITISCKDGTKESYKPASIGAINSLTVVVDNDLWKGKVGDKIREYFAAPAVGLTWDEPLFTMNQIPPKVFSGSVRNTRSILFVQEDTVDIAHIKSNLYAAPQKIGVIKGRNEDEIIENIEATAPEIIDEFKNLEIEEAQKRFLKSLNKEKVLEEKFAITLNFPSAYRVDKQEDNFVWIAREIQKGNMNIIAYTIPYKTFENDTSLVRDIVRMRDSIGEKYIPGPDVVGKITHMRTEPAFSPSIFETKIAKRKAIEVRGIWDIKNYPMAGPFLTYIIDDKQNNRKLVVEGFVFAPATNKRDDIFELEAIMKTVHFKEAPKAKAP